MEDYSRAVALKIGEKHIKVTEFLGIFYSSGFLKLLRPPGRPNINKYK